AQGKSTGALQHGQLQVSYAVLAADWRWHRERVRRFIAKLQTLAVDDPRNLTPIASGNTERGIAAVYLVTNFHLYNGVYTETPKTPAKPAIDTGPDTGPDTASDTARPAPVVASSRGATRPPTQVPTQPPTHIKERERIRERKENVSTPRASRGADP